MESYAKYYGLIFCCPLGSETIGCKFKKLRNLKLENRLKFYEALNDEEKKAKIQYHLNCLTLREMKSIKQKTIKHKKV